MKPSLLRPGLMCVSVTLLAATSASAQHQIDRQKGPTSKIYLAETNGETQIQNGERIFAARQSTTFDASGTVIETKAGSHNVLVYSNGTGLFVDGESRVEVSRFVQEPFSAEHNEQLDTRYEPSVSQSNIVVSHGAVGICTSQLLSGSTMLYTTPHATINIRGGKVVIESSPEGTIVDLVEGDLTVRAGARDVGGQILRVGERAIIRPGPPDADPLITIQPIPAESRTIGDRRVGIACNARRSVTFGVAEEDAGNEAAGAQADAQQITASPTVPSNPPANIVISPDRLPGT